MKKFSKLTGEKIPDEPKQSEKNYTEKDILKFGIKKLMDNYLAVQMYGPITKYHVAGTMKVSGKELFIEALMDMLEEASSKDKIKLLESLKLESNNWELIDNKVSKLNENIDLLSDSKLVPHKVKIKSLFKRFKTTEEILYQVDMQLSKISEGRNAFLRGVASKELLKESKYNKDILSLISKKCFDRAYLLGCTTI